MVILSRAQDFQLYEMQNVKALGIFFNAVLVIGKENPNKTKQAVILKILYKMPMHFVLQIAVLQIQI